jgi:hypothetical protein
VRQVGHLQNYTEMRGQQNTSNLLYCVEYIYDNGTSSCKCCCYYTQKRGLYIQKRGFRVYNEKANTSLLSSVNSCVITYLGLQEIWWEGTLGVNFFSLLCWIQCPVMWKDDKGKEVIIHVRPFMFTAVSLLRNHLVHKANIIRRQIGK